MRRKEWSAKRETEALGRESFGRENPREGNFIYESQVTQVSPALPLSPARFSYLDPSIN